MLRRRRHGGSKTKVKEPSTTAEVVPKSLSSVSLNQSTESLASVEESLSSFNGSLDTFAKMMISERHTARKRHSGTMRAEKLIMYPCFGHFAGQRLYFDLKKSVEHNVMSIKVRTDNQTIAMLQHRQGKRKETVRDQCIKFAHEATTSLVSHQPASLKFSCEQVINLNLNEIPYQTLPPRYRSQFTGCDNTVRIHIHPRSQIPRNTAADSFITMKLKPNLSVRELQWMISKRLNLPNPSSITLYVHDSLGPLNASAPLSSEHSDIVCNVTPAAQHLQSHDNPPHPVSVCVSIIGRGVSEVLVYRHTTLFDFEQAVKSEFGLNPDSFLYFPDVLNNHIGSSNSNCPLRMHAVLDSSTSTALLLHHEKRSFPILYGRLSVSNQRTLKSLLLYRMTLSDLDLLKSGPVIGFEVTGPTIPIQLKTINNLSSNSSEFCVISVQPHAVSVNPEWTIAVLIKFLVCISGFPCSNITISDKVLPTDSLVKTKLLDKPWFVVEGNEYLLPKDLPTAVFS